MHLAGEVSELLLQRALWFKYSGSSRAMFPNVYYFPWESDVLRVTHSGYLHEYEIKISMSDFKADKKKSRWRRMHESATAGANRFYYVVPDGMLTPSEVPEWAGLLLYRGEWAHERKKAPQRHAIKATDSQLGRCYKSSMYRHWSLLLNL